MHRLACALAFVFVVGCSCATTQETADSGNGITRDAGPGHDAFVSSTTDGGARTLPSRCKRGMAYGHDTHADLAVLQPAVGWWYDWASQPDDALRDGSYAALGVDFTPMVWGGTFDPSTVITQIPTGTHALLGFNEPNFGSQSNLSAMQAAALWPQVEQIADARDLLLVSPAVNFCGGNCTDTDPFHWLTTFLADCPDCRVDRIAFHLYVGCDTGAANHA